VVRASVTTWGVRPVYGKARPSSSGRRVSRSSAVGVAACFCSVMPLPARGGVARVSLHESKGIPYLDAMLVQMSTGGTILLKVPGA